MSVPCYLGTILWNKHDKHQHFCWPWQTLQIRNRKVCFNHQFAWLSKTTVSSETFFWIFKPCWRHFETFQVLANSPVSKLVQLESLTGQNNQKITCFNIQCIHSFSVFMRPFLYQCYTVLPCLRGLLVTSHFSSLALFLFELSSHWEFCTKTELRQIYLLDKAYSFVPPYWQPVIQPGRGSMMYTQDH